MKTFLRVAGVALTGFVFGCLTMHCRHLQAENDALTDALDDSCLCCDDFDPCADCDGCDGSADAAPTNKPESASDCAAPVDTEVSNPDAAEVPAPHED